MIKKIEFRASIAPIMSGIRTGGDGLRLTLDVPESDVTDAVALIALRNCPLKITVEVDSSPVATRVSVPTEEKEAKPSKKREPKSSGPFGKFWEKIIGKRDLNVFAQPGLRAILDSLDGEDDRGKLLGAFGVTSRAEISPEALKKWMVLTAAEHGYDVSGAVMIVEQVEREMQG